MKKLGIIVIALALLVVGMAMATTGTTPEETGTSELFSSLSAGIAAGIVGAVYGGYAYLTGRLTGTKPENSFELNKLIGTVGVAFIVGAAMSAIGMPITEASMLGILATIGAVELGQKVIKPFFAWLGTKFTGRPA